MADILYEPLKHTILGFGEYKKYKWAIAKDEDGYIEANVECYTDIERHYNYDIIDIIKTRDTYYDKCCWNEEDKGYYFGWWYDKDKELTYKEVRKIIYEVIDYLAEEGIV